MIIGIDIDGVITDIYSYAKKHAKRFSREHNIKSGGTKGVKPGHLYELFGWNKQQDGIFWDDFIWDYSMNVKHYKSASKYLKKLKADGHELFIITKRIFLGIDNYDGIKMERIVKDRFKENDIIYDRLISAVPDNSKVPSIKRYNVDIMIDDEVGNLTEISEIIPTICYDTKYNKSFSHKNSYRCKNWREIYKLITKLSENSSKME